MTKGQRPARSVIARRVRWIVLAIIGIVFLAAWAYTGYQLTRPQPTHNSSPRSTSAHLTVPETARPLNETRKTRAPIVELQKREGQGRNLPIERII